MGPILNGPDALSGHDLCGCHSLDAFKEKTVGWSVEGANVLFLKIMANTENYIKIAILENDIEAQLLDSILTERNIPHLMRTYHDTAYDGLYQAQKGWGYVGAPKSYQKEILDIISHLRKEANSAADRS
jgi:hypothetical protein